MLKFEDYTADRSAGVQRVCRFLGVNPTPQTSIDPTVIHNKGESRPFHKGLTTRINQSPVYRRVLRPFIPLSLRAKIQRMLAPPPPPRPAPPTAQTLKWLAEQLSDDTQRLAQILSPEWINWSDSTNLLEHSPGVTDKSSPESGESP